MQEEKKIKIIVINRPNKEESTKKIKELCKFLKEVWFLPLK